MHIVIPFKANALEGIFFALKSEAVVVRCRPKDLNYKLITKVLNFEFV